MINSDIIKKQINQLKEDKFKKEFFKSGVGSIILKVASLGFGFISSVLFARLLGAEGYGVYSYYLAIITIMAIPAQMGLPNLVVRETAKAESNKRWDQLIGIWRWSTINAFTISIILLIFSFIVISLYSSQFTSIGKETFIWGLISLPFLALNSLRGAALRGLRKVVKGQLPDQLIRPGLIIVLTVLFALIINKDLSPQMAMIISLTGTVIAFIIGAALLKKESPIELSKKVKPSYSHREWYAAVIPFAMVAGMSVLNIQIGTITLGIFSSSAEVGIYRVAVLGSTLIQFAYQAISIIAMPYFTKHMTLGQHDELQRIATLTTKWSFILSLPMIVLLVLAGQWFIGIFFGFEYKSAYIPLLILIAAEIARVCFGTVGEILDMCGFERDTVKGFTIAAITNIILCIVLVPFYGMLGAAIAAAISRCLWNLLLWLLVKKRVGIDSSILSMHITR